LAVVLAVALGTLLPMLDAAVDGKLPTRASALLFSGGPEAAASILQAISGSLVTVTSLTFSLTVVTLQLASSQFSPRLLRTFTADRFVHATLALFLAAFAFALTVLRSVRQEQGTSAGFVPEISVTVAFVLAITSVMGLVLFLAHLTREIRVETMLDRVQHETRATLDRVFPSNRPRRGPAPLPSPGAVRLTSSSSGFLTSVDDEKLLKAAVDSGVVLRIDRAPGSFLVEGVPFATAWPTASGPTVGTELREKLDEHVNDAIVTGSERTHVQDVGFGLRQLVDVATKALSPGINDPTTAVHVLGHLSVLLCQLAARTPGPRHVADEAGRVRVVVVLPVLGEFLDLCLDQPRTYGAGDPAVAERLLSLLQELAWCDQERSYDKEIQEHLARIRDAISAAEQPPAQRRHLLGLAETVGRTPPIGRH
jgi:uncharacterized membrane protein